MPKVRTEREKQEEQFWNEAAGLVNSEGLSEAEAALQHWERLIERLRVRLDEATCHPVPPSSAFEASEPPADSLSAFADDLWEVADRAGDSEDAEELRAYAGTIREHLHAEATGAQSDESPAEALRQTVRDLSERVMPPGEAEGKFPDLTAGAEDPPDMKERHRLSKEIRGLVDIIRAEVERYVSQQKDRERRDQRTPSRRMAGAMDELEKLVASEGGWAARAEVMRPLRRLRKAARRRDALERALAFHLEHGYADVPQWEALDKEEKEAFSPPPEAAYSPAGLRYFRAVYKLREEPPFKSPTAYSRALVQRVDGPQDSTAALNWLKKNGWVQSGEGLEDIRPRLEAQAEKMKAEGAF